MIVALLIAQAAAVAVPAATPQAAVAAAMADSAAGWNAGSLDRFMAVYADDAVYASGKDVVRGKAAIAQRYAKSFSGGANSRGRLSFRPVAWRLMGAGHMLHVARWTLTPSSGEAQSGLTTLVFERRVQGWRIIADHSS